MLPGFWQFAGSAAGVEISLTWPLRFDQTNHWQQVANSCWHQYLISRKYEDCPIFWDPEKNVGTFWPLWFSNFWTCNNLSEVRILAARAVRSRVIITNIYGHFPLFSWGHISCGPVVGYAGYEPKVEVSNLLVRAIAMRGMYESRISFFIFFS